MKEKTIERLTWANRVLVLCMTLLGAVAAFEWLDWVKLAEGVTLTNVLSGASVLCGLASSWCSSLLPAKDPAAATPRLGAGVVLLFLGAFALSACSGAAWRATISVRGGGTLIDRGLAAAHKAKRLKCKAKHGAKTQAFKKCLDDSRERLAFLQWRKFGMPGLNTGIITTVTTLTLYDKAAGEKMSWDLFVTMIKPLACGLSRAANAWKDLLKEKAAAVLSIVGMIKGVSCEK